MTLGHDPIGNTNFMSQFYFRLQAKRISRKTAEFGLHPILAVILSPILFIGLSLFFFAKVPFAEYVYPTLALYFIVGKDTHQKLRFLSTQFDRYSLFKIRLLENLLICVPFMVFLVYKSYWIQASVLLCFSLLLAGLKPLKSNMNRMPTPFSNIPFEFPIGFRKSIVFVMLSYIIVLIALQVDNFNLGLVILGFQFFIILTFYSQVEPIHFVRIFDGSAQNFLWKKLKTGILYSLYFVLPISILLTTFNPDKFLFILIVIALGLLLVSLMICVKYSSFPKSMSVIDSIIFAVSLGIPPLMLFFIPKLYKKSIAHLKPVLK